MTPFIPRTLAITPGSGQSSEATAQWARSVLLAGVDALQLRDKKLADGRLFAAGRLLRSLVPPSRILLVNQRADIAVAIGASGVHLTSASPPLARLRATFPSLLFGQSTHTLEEIEAACEAGADYVTYGPVYAPLSKPPLLRPVGPRRLRQAAAVGPPVLALGGVTRSRLQEIAAAGAAGVAGIGTFTETDALVEFVEEAHRLFSRRELRRRA